MTRIRTLGEIAKGHLVDLCMGAETLDDAFLGMLAALDAWGAYADDEDARSLAAHMRSIPRDEAKRSVDDFVFWTPHKPLLAIAAGRAP